MLKKKDELGLSGITILILILMLSTIIILTLVFLPKNKNGKPTTNIPFFSPSPSGNIANFSPTTVSPLQKTKIGETTQAQVQSLTGIINQQTLPDGSIEYNLKSALVNRPDNVIVKDGKVIYERLLLPDNPSDPNYLKMTDIIAKYGQPEATANGSNYYGFSASTYIYASKGFAVIGNTNANEALEVQNFIPTTVDQYKSLYGQDLNPNAQPPKEGPTAAQEALLNFKSSLPYVTPDMGIKYDKSTDKTTVIINQNNKDVGLKAFNDYLAKFGITDQSQVNNLSIIYQ